MESFEDFYGILGFLRSSAPGKLKPIRYALESRSSPVDHTERWAKILANFNREIRTFHAEKRRVFRLRYATNWPDSYCVRDIITEISKDTGVARATIYRWLTEMRDQIEQRFIKLGYIEDRSNDSQRFDC